MGGVYGRVQLRRRLVRLEISVFHLPPAACWQRLAITVDKCCDWLQQLPREYSC